MKNMKLLKVFKKTAESILNVLKKQLEKKANFKQKMV